MHVLDQHPSFSLRKDPVSGVSSYYLNEVLAPVQQHFYFVSDSIDQGEQFLWFTCSWPPSSPQSLACISLDPGHPELHHFPQAIPETARPLLSPQGGVWFGVGSCVYHLEKHGAVEEVFRLPEAYIDGRFLYRLATHLTLSADGRYLLLDGHVGDVWFVGTAELETGKFRLIREFFSNHNHAQFSPVDADTFLIAHDQQSDPITGEFVHHTKRTWLMNMKSDEYRCLNPEHSCAPFLGACHEWWSRDGWMCYIDYERGAFEMDLPSGAKNHLWKEPLCHAHCDSTRRYWCADESPYYWKERPCKVLFYDRETEQRVEIESGLSVPLPELPGARGKYHIDPHPQFSPQDSWIVYTATPQGRPTVALCPVSQFLE